MLQQNENSNDSSASSRSRLGNYIDEEFWHYISDTGTCDYVPSPFFPFSSNI